MKRAHLVTLAAQGTVEHWALAYLRSTDLRHKLAPPRPPGRWAVDPEPLPWEAPGRPALLRVEATTRRSVRRSKLGQPVHRARLVHTFLHHELQAAELFCAALLRWPDTPPAFRRGLLGICQDELRHMAMYRDWLLQHGHDYGSFPVRDWFWERARRCDSPLQFVALVGLGFEGGNLDHTARFAAWFREAGDEEAARLQETIGREEIPHVRFAVHWFREWTGGLDFERWCAELVAPLTPRLLRGTRLDEEARRAAGLDNAFLDRLRAVR